MSGEWGSWDTKDDPENSTFGGAFGNPEQVTSFKPQVKILKRNDNKGTNNNKQNDSESKQPTKEDYKTREQKYLRAREKIFGNAADGSPTESPEPWENTKNNNNNNINSNKK